MSAVTRIHAGERHLARSGAAIVVMLLLASAVPAQMKNVLLREPGQEPWPANDVPYKWKLQTRFWNGHGFELTPCATCSPMLDGAEVTYPWPAINGIKTRSYFVPELIWLNPALLYPTSTDDLLREIGDVVAISMNSDPLFNVGLGVDPEETGRPELFFPVNYVPVPLGRSSFAGIKGRY